MRWTFLICAFLAYAMPAQAEEKSQYLTPDLITVEPVVMMRSGTPSGCGYTFMLLFQRPNSSVQVVSGSFNFSTLSDTAISLAGTFKLVVGEVKMKNGTFDQKDIASSRVTSAWAKSNDMQFEQTSKFLKQAITDEVPHFFGGTTDLGKAEGLLGMWESIASDGGQIGYNTTGHGYDVVIDLPAGLVRKYMSESVTETVHKCMRNFLPDVIERMKSEMGNSSSEK